MFDRMMGAYLVETNRLEAAQLLSIYARQESVRARLGVIAVARQFMTSDEAAKINKLQAERNAKFGELAVEEGYLTEEQLSEVLRDQGSAYHAFAQVVTDLGFLTIDSLNDALHEYQEHYRRSDAEMESLLQDDFEQIVRMHLDSSDVRIQEMTILCINNMMRLVDHHLYIGQSINTGAIEGEVMAAQGLSGNMDVMSVLCGDYEAIRKVAGVYVGEQFIETKDDALDAICELINTFDGMFVREEIGESEDLLPPSFRTEPSLLEGAEIYEMPIYLCGVTINYAIARGADFD